jgi:hypothetical protein
MGKRTAGILERLKRQYRVVFIDDESMDEVASYNLTMGKLYVALSSVLVIVVILTVSLMLLTPLRFYIPGYGNEKARARSIQLKHTVDSLSDLVSAQQKYEENIKKVITGDVGKEAVRDTTMLDMKKVKQDDMNSMLPKASQIKATAIQNIKKEERSQKKKKAINE